MSTYDWQQDAECTTSGLPPETWHPEHPSQYRLALRITTPICAPCPVRTECLSHALDMEHYGIWAQTTPRMRRAMRSQRAGGVREQRENEEGAA